MRVLPCLCILVGSLAVVGCGVFGKKSAAPANPPPAAPSADLRSPQNLPTTTPVAATDAPAAVPVSSGSGLLAGQVVDGVSRRPAQTYIQVLAAREPNDPPAAPIEVAADTQGYFTIQGLQPGRHYQLIARARDGDRLLAGSTWATPPNPRVIIRISEDFAGATTPAPPPPPVPPKRPGAFTPNPPATPAWPPSTEPAAPAPPARPGLGAPIGEVDPAPTPAPVDPSRVADGQRYSDRGPAPVRIPGSGARRETPIVPPTGPGPQSLADPGAPPVPFCSLTGKQLYDFALYDLNGQVWDFRRDHGRLTLLDFWGVWCPPCREALPHLKILSDQYGSAGLQVVGVHYPKEGYADMKTQIAQMRDRLRLNYPILLGGDRPEGPCPVRTQFQVTAFPTMVLIRADGTVVWKHVGALDQRDLAVLNQMLSQELGTR